MKIGKIDVGTFVIGLLVTGLLSTGATAEGVFCKDKTENGSPNSLNTRYPLVGTWCDSTGKDFSIVFDSTTYCFLTSDGTKEGGLWKTAIDTNLIVISSGNDLLFGTYKITKDALTMRLSLFSKGKKREGTHFYRLIRCDKPKEEEQLVSN